MRSGAFCKSGRIKEGALSPVGEVTKSEKSLSKMSGRNLSDGRREGKEWCFDRL